jgi:osmotically-inducible protein OsmY
MAVKTDEEIKHDVVEQLEWDARIDTTDIRVDVDKGRVILKGSVPTYTGRRAAVNDAYWIDGVVGVDNDLKVSLPKSEFIDDSEIERSVRNTIFWDIDLRLREMDVFVERGVVTIRGNVDTFWKKVKAEEKIYSLIGVVDVANKLAIVPTRKKSDKDIAIQIIKSLERNTNINIDNINIVVNNGIVTLSGSVSSWYDHDSVFNATLYTEGVTDVIDNLQIINLP